MAVPSGRPVADPHRGRAAFAEHLPRVLRGRTMKQLGWKQPTPLSLIVPMYAGPEGADDYTLRLSFEYYPVWPASGIFVNPETGAFDQQRDLYWLPRIGDDPGFRVHQHYGHPGYTGQLLCCSFVAEFYRIEHQVQAEHLWDGERFTFEATIERVQRTLRSSFSIWRWKSVV